MDVLQTKLKTPPFVQKWFYPSTIALISGWCFYVNQASFQTNMPFILGAMVLPLTIVKNQSVSSVRYATVVALMVVLLHLTKSTTLHYLMSAISILLIIEMWFGKQESLPLVLMLAISPAISNILNIWSFPIRLRMTALSASLFKWMHSDIDVKGNTLMMGNEAFSVDPECMGLRLLTTAMVSTIAIIAFFTKGKHLRFFEVILWLICALMFAVLSNFTRLLLLIAFHVGPDNPLHDVIGILCLIIYTIIPLILLIRWRKRYLTDKIARNESQSFTQNGRIIATLLLIFTVETSYSQQWFQREPVNTFIIPLQNKEVLDDGVIKLTSNNTLIYIKPPASFFQGSHDPRYCWRGSGYQFRKSRIDQVQGHEVYMAELQDDGVSLYTAWWYQSKQHITPHDWEWRWNQLRYNHSYSLINITCSNEHALKTEIVRLMNVIK